MPHHFLPQNVVPRGLGHLMGLVTAVDFISTLSVLIASQEIRGGIEASPAEFVWVLTAYAASSMFVIPLLARLARRWHYRNLMIAGLALSALGALLSGICESPSTLIASRVLQGAGGGGLFTMSRVYLQLAVRSEDRAPHLRGYMVGLLGAVAPVPWITTVLVQASDWRAVFLLQAVVAVATLVLISVTLRSEHHTPRSLGTLDWPMVFAFGAGALLLLHGLEDLELARPGPHQIILFAAAFAALTFAIWRLQRHHDPLLDFKILNGRRYMVGLVFYGVYYLINGATSFLYPRIFEAGAGLTIETTGALLSIGSVTTVVLLFPYFRIARHLGDRRRLIAAAFAIAAGALLWMATTLTSDIPPSTLIAPMVLKGIFPVLGVVQIAGLTYRDVPHEDFAHAYALKNIMRQLANAFAAGVASYSWQSLEATYRSELIGQVNIFNPSYADSPWSNSTQGLALLSHEVNQQVTILVGNTLLTWIAAIALVAVPLVLMQQRLK